MPRPDVESPRNEKEHGQNILVGDDSSALLKGPWRSAVHQTHDVAPYSNFRKILIMIILCSVQIFDIFNASSAIVALPMLRAYFNLSPDTLSWVISGYNLTFVAFVLAAVSLANTLHPKSVFCIGYAIVGLSSIPISTSVHPIMTIVFRAVQGIGAALNMSAAVSMIVKLFPEPARQSRAILTYSTFAAVVNILGLVPSSVSWRRAYYITASVVVIFVALSWFFLPTYTVPARRYRRSVDWPGVGTLTSCLILFVYSISNGGDAVWDSAQIIATLVVSMVLFALPSIIESVVQEPAITSRTWSHSNFTPLFCYAWSLYWFLLANKLIFIELWHLSAISASTRFITLDVSGGIAAYLTGLVGPRIVQHIVLLSEHVFLGVGAALLARTDKLETYWSYVFPRMIPVTYAK